MNISYFLTVELRVNLLLQFSQHAYLHFCKLLLWFRSIHSIIQHHQHLILRWKGFRVRISMECVVACSVKFHHGGNRPEANRCQISHSAQVPHTLHYPLDSILCFQSLFPFKTNTWWSLTEINLGNDFFHFSFFTHYCFSWTMFFLFDLFCVLLCFFPVLDMWLSSTLLIDFH